MRRAAFGRVHACNSQRESQPVSSATTGISTSRRSARPAHRYALPRDGSSTTADPPSSNPASGRRRPSRVLGITDRRCARRMRSSSTEDSCRSSSASSDALYNAYDASGARKEKDPPRSGGLTDRSARCLDITLDSRRGGVSDSAHPGCPPTARDIFATGSATPPSSPVPLSEPVRRAQTSSGVRTHLLASYNRRVKNPMASPYRVQGLPPADPRSFVDNARERAGLRRDRHDIDPYSACGCMACPEVRRLLLSSTVTGGGRERLDRRGLLVTAYEAVSGHPSTQAARGDPADREEDGEAHTDATTAGANGGGAIADASGWGPPRAVTRRELSSGCRREDIVRRPSAAYRPAVTRE